MPPRTTCGALDGADDRVEILPGGGDGQAAQTIIAAKGDDDNLWMESDDCRKTDDTILGRVPADACIDDAVVITLRIQVALQGVGIALTLIGAKAGCK